MKKFIKEPIKIENNSMEIIESLMHPHNFNDTELKIVKRVIHTTADFDYQDNIRFNNNVIDIALEAIKNGCNIVTDTNMAKAGINKKALHKFGMDIKCFISDDDIAKEAKERGVTRAIVSMEHAVKDEKNKIFVIGNAPTALVKLINLQKEGKANPKVIIGVPVGFVGAAESKDLLASTDIPHITTLGRKGGSNVAASIINALMYMLTNR